MCGPVVAAAVILPSCRQLPASLAGLDDSKRLSPAKRESLALAIGQTALAVGIGRAEPVEIDRINIRRAALLAMSRAIADLRPLSVVGSSVDCILPDFILVDGRDVPDALVVPGRAVVRGDQISASIAAASVIAKTHRDAIMVQLAQQFPGYGWEENAGYPTAKHLRALESLGVTVVHRRTFRPVAEILARLPSV
ncbi:MAG: ribonuclease HII [Magnetococcus sp. YQC-5]